MKDISWQAAGMTDCGKVRKHNEDNFSISSDVRVFVVADGMGGTHNGALASKLAVEEMENCRQSNSVDLSDSEAVKSWLCKSIAQANARIVGEQPSAQKQMGTTIVAAVQSDDGILHIAHVGDSRAYLIRDGAASSQTMDHSVVMEMYKNGRLSLSQCKESPFRHLITRCLGHDQNVECDYVAIDVLEDDWIVMASDGLVAVVDDEELAKIVQTSSDATDLCNRLIARTLDGGAPDNVTILAIHYDTKKDSAAVKDGVQSANETSTQPLHA